MLNKIKKFLTNKAFRMSILSSKGFYNHLSDEKFIKKKFKVNMGYDLDLNNPQTFNEKLQWLKLYDRKPIYTTMVDKYAVKDYVANIIGKEYIIPTLGVYEKFEDIDFSKLPNQFVLKCTHDSGGLVIVKDKSKLDIEKAKKKINRCLKRNYYYSNREWPYKNVKPRIIAEKYMVDESGYELKDYKFFCFDGKAELMFIAKDRGLRDEEIKFNFYDMNFNFLHFTRGHPNFSGDTQKPKSFDKMKELAEVLSKNIPHVRIDFYDINGQIYFGEITFFPASGLMPFKPSEWDKKLGDYIVLPKKTN